MKYAWIDGQRRAYPLPAMCGTLAVSVSGYRAWRRGGSPHRKRLELTRFRGRLAAWDASGFRGCN